MKIHITETIKVSEDGSTMHQKISKVIDKNELEAYRLHLEKTHSYNGPVEFYFIMKELQS